MTASERLSYLSGLTGTASALLLAIGAGATTGEALADYSQLSGATAAEHILVDRQRGAGYYSDKKRKKNIVNVDGVLYEFATEREAISFINLQPVNKEYPEPLRKVALSSVENVVESNTITNANVEIDNVQHVADYATLLAAYDKWLEQDEEEALMLLL